MDPQLTAENTEAQRAQIVQFVQATQLGSGRAGTSNVRAQALNPGVCPRAVGGNPTEPQDPDLPSPSVPHTRHLREGALSTHRQPSFSKSALSQAGPGSQHLGSRKTCHGLPCPWWGWGLC